jgi:hypothetical protein
MSSIFKSLKYYAESWKVVNVTKFEEDDIQEISQAEVIESEFGYSVCFTLRSGGKKYIPLEKESSAGLGDIIDVRKATIITLAMQGRENIYRIRI